MPEARLRRTRAAYDDGLIAICQTCGEPLTGDNPEHAHGLTLKQALADTAPSELEPPIDIHAADDDYLWGV